MGHIILVHRVMAHVTEQCYLSWAPHFLDTNTIMPSGVKKEQVNQTSRTFLYPLFWYKTSSKFKY